MFVGGLCLRVECTNIIEYIYIDIFKLTIIKIYVQVLILQYICSNIYCAIVRVMYDMTRLILMFTYPNLICQLYGWTLTYGLILLLEEIRQSPVEGTVVYPNHFQGFLHPRWLFGISEPSTVSKNISSPGSMAAPVTYPVQNNQGGKSISSPCLENWKTPEASVR